MNFEEYASNPCKASSLPYWKTVSVTIPENIRVVRDDKFSELQNRGNDEPYFKMVHDLRTVNEPFLPKGYEITQCSIDDFVRHINSCYTYEHITIEELLNYKMHPVYQPDLWISVKDTETGKNAATGIAELDVDNGEGTLEWIQVLPEYRRKGLGTFVVCELLKRMKNKAKFVTVSGRMNNESKPLALYEACGFTNPVIWHIITSR